MFTDCDGRLSVGLVINTVKNSNSTVNSPTVARFPKNVPMFFRLLSKYSASLLIPRVPLILLSTRACLGFFLFFLHLCCSFSSVF